MAFLGVSSSSILSARKSDSLKNVTAIPLQFLVIAGGGSGGLDQYNASISSGGGAGGYRSSVSGENSGGGASAETTPPIFTTQAYPLTVGSGGPRKTSLSSFTGLNGNNGNVSVFVNVLSIGGGGGGGYLEPAFFINGRSGGSGGGGGTGEGSLGDGGAGTAGQGYAGGTPAFQSGFGVRSAGGGGAGGLGGNGVPSTNTFGAGGVGVASSITGSSVTRAVGGTAVTAEVNGTANTGNGGSKTNSSGSGGIGGSGVIILRVPSPFTASFSAGVTQTSATVGSNTVYTITAAGPTDTVTFS